MDKKYYKLVVLGEGRVGKTSLTLRYCNGEFDDNQISTNNASYLEKNVTLDNDETVSISIWDTAGQEKFNALAPMYYRDALGAIIVYDITFKESFDKVQKWIAELKQFGGKDIFLVVAGNKCDLENKRQINKQDAENFAKSQGAHHFQVSAKADVGIDEMFQCLVKGVHSSNKKTKGVGISKKKKNKLKVGSQGVQKVDKNAIYNNQEQDSDDNQDDKQNNNQQGQQYEVNDSDDEKKQKKDKKSKKKDQESIKLKNDKKQKKKKDGCC